jgi:hypothetical protein
MELVFGRKHASISRYLEEWAPLWGKAGERLSILDFVTVPYLNCEHPEDYYIY